MNRGRGAFIEERNQRIRLLAVLLKAVRNDQLDWSLPAQRRGTLSGRDAAPELTWTYLQRVPRRWPGKGPAAKPQTIRSATRSLKSKASIQPSRTYA
ncbi:hypothetical protein DZD52_08965 [Xanthomonas nasturtii]|uniref:Uncharacterized protein n=1 Tax=Xanthomonas nasturtii TaxID=1843581 RepID=A0A3E1KLM5_9XANT|nr:hypothetical protein DZD52_08965 [Xanthomonas nasturtii]